MMARRIAARPSLGEPGSVWIEIHPSSTGASLGAHLSPRDARLLAGALLLAVAQIEEDRIR